MNSSAAARSRILVLSLAILAFAHAARAQQTIVWLPWTSPLSAGPRAQNYPPTQDDRDIWVVEDFTIDRDWFLHQFSCTGSGPASTLDVRVVILTDWPTTGTTVLESVPGTGGCNPSAGEQGWSRFFAGFGGQRLRAGSYKIMWMADLNPSIAPTVMFVQAGAYSVGQGTPNNAYQYNPGLGSGLPLGALDPVMSDFNEQGFHIGVNFKLTGNPAPPACPVDFDADGDVGTDADIEAFFSCLAGTCCATCPPDADFNGDGDVGTDTDIEAFFRVLAGQPC